MELSSELQALLSSADEEARLQGVRSLGNQGVEGHLKALLQCLGDASWRVRKEASDLFLRWPGAGRLSGEVIELLHAHDNAGLRNAAVEILSRLGREAVPSLLEEVTCSDADVRKFVLDILGDIGDDSTVGAMIRALEDPDQNVRNAAAENLGKLRAAAAVPALLASMENGDLWFRFTVLAAIAQIGVPIAIEQILPYRLDPLLRKAVFDCLGKIGGPEMIPVLVEGLGDRMNNVRAAAVLSLVRIGRKNSRTIAQELRPLMGEESGRAVVDLLQSHDPEIRLAAVQLLRWVGDPSNAAALLALLDDEAVRQSAMEALIAMGTPAAQALLPCWDQSTSRQRAYLAYLAGQTCFAPALPQLIEGLQSEDGELRMVAAQGLGRLGAESALTALVAGLDDALIEVRGHIQGALSAIGNRYPDATIKALQPVLAAENPELRLCAVRILGRLDGSEVVAALQLALKDEMPKVRGAAVQALSSARDGIDNSALRLALTDEDSEVRRLAVGALAQVPPEDALPLLGLALQDDDIWVRAMVVRTLGRFGAAAQKMVEMSLADPIGLVAIAALETLADLCSDTARPKIVAALQHPDQEVVVAALQLLSHLDDQTWLDPLTEQLLGHPQWEVRSCFVRILADVRGALARDILEARYLVEGEDLVREQLRQVLAELSGEG